MMMIMVQNLTETKPDGTSDYAVMVQLGSKIIAQLIVEGHVRQEHASILLRKIADEWDASEKKVLEVHGGHC